MKHGGSFRMSNYQRVFLFGVEKNLYLINMLGMLGRRRSVYLGFIDELLKSVP